MLLDSKDNVLSVSKWERIKSLIYENIDVLRVGLSHGPPVLIPTLKFELSKESSPVKVKLLNYTQEQRLLLLDMRTFLVNSGMEYINPTARWASTPLIVPNLERPNFESISNFGWKTATTYPITTLCLELSKN